MSSDEFNPEESRGPTFEDYLRASEEYDASDADIVPEEILRRINQQFQLIAE